MACRLDGLTNAIMRPVVVVTGDTERITAALEATFGTYRRSAIRTSCNGLFSAGQSLIRPRGCVNDFAELSHGSRLTSEIATVPAGHWFFVAFSLEQFLAALRL